jgi:hypothetical protein
MQIDTSLRPKKNDILELSKIKTFSILIEFIEKINNVYDIKHTYYKVDFMMNLMIFILYQKYMHFFYNFDQVKKFDLTILK